MYNKYALKPGDHLYAENARLRKKIEELEHGIGVDKVRLQHEKELSKWENKFSRLEKIKNKYHDLWQSKCQANNDLQVHTGILECTIKELDKRIVEKDSFVAKKEVEIEELKGLVKKMTAQINRDFSNSSIPSSQCVNRKKISNSREKSGKKSGGQPGHEGHRRQAIPEIEANIVELPVPSCVIENPEGYYDTGKTVTKQLIKIKLSVQATNYVAIIYRNRNTGGRIHSEFPKGLVNEVTYDDSVKALAAMLNSYCNVSMDKVNELIYDLSDGKINISKGRIATLAKEFNEKSKHTQDEIFKNLMNSPIMHTDATNVRINGKGWNVFVTASGKDVLYFAREHKGHEGIKGTPVEEYLHTLVHDHDITFYKYGAHHQECLAHVLRYLQDSINNESELTWNTKMKQFLSGLIHEYKQRNGNFSEKEIEAYKNEYNRLLGVAGKEYREHPPTKYYKEGFNLAKRLKQYENNHLLFLTQENVPYTNNHSELLLRQVKRKVKQVGSYRSDESLSDFCGMLGVIETAKQNQQGIYKTLCHVY